MIRGIRRDGWFYLLVFAGALAFFLGVTWFYAGDIDEGFYAVAAELTAAGKMPYRDFFYPQAPLLPYLLAAPIRLFGPGLFAERITCSCFAAGSAVLIAWAARREGASRWLIAVLEALFCLHELVWQWIPTVRAYGPATFFLLLSLVPITDPARAPSRRAAALAGFSAAVAIGCRLLFLPMLPIVLAAIWLRGSSRPLRRGLGLLALGFAMAAGHVASLPPGWLLGPGVALALAILGFRNREALASRGAAGMALLGAALAASPALWLYARAPGAFVFDNWGFHAARSSGGAWNNAGDSLQDASALLGAGGMFGSPSAAGMQFALLILLNVVAAGRAGAELRAGPWLAAAAIFLTGLRPNPIYEHYFTCCAPLLVLGAIGLGRPAGRAGAPDGQTGDDARAARSIWRADLRLALAALLLFLAAGRSVLNSRLYLGQFGPWNLSSLRPAKVDAARRLVAQQSALHPGPILPLWPGSAIGSAAKILPGFEDNFARKVAGDLPVEKRRAWHLATYDDFKQAVRERTPALLVFDREADQIDVGELEKIAKEAGYEQVATGQAGVRIWARR